MTEIPKYNFKKIEDLLTESSEVNTQKNSNRRNSQSSHKSYRNLNSSNNQSLRNTSLKRNKSKNSYTSNNKVLNTTSTTIKDYSSQWKI